MTEFTRAERSELPALTALWSECFGDSTALIEGFWARLFPQATVFTAEQNGTPAAMLCALPTQWITDDGLSVSAAYLYAVCTAAAYRGKGLCRRLTAYAEAALRQDGIELAYLAPATKELFDFYRKLGYYPAFSAREYSVFSKHHPYKITGITPSIYRNLREMQLYGNCISVGEPLLDWLRFSGAALYRIETAQEVCCAAVIHGDGILTFAELLPNVPEAAEALCAKLGAAAARVRVPGSTVPSGMAKLLVPNIPKPQNAYLGPDFG